MTRKLTHKEFMERFMEKNPNADNIEILGEYKGSGTKIKCRCLLDGHIWGVRPSDLYNGHGCPKCRGVAKKTHEEFIKELEEINSDIEVLSTYVNAKTKIKCKCLLDGHVWEMKPSDLLNGHGCPKCGRKSTTEGRRKTHEEFIKELEEINPNIEILGTYVKSCTKIKCKCLLDGYVWETMPSTLLSGHGCPKCNSSKGEKRISEYLEDNGIDFISQHTFKDCRCKLSLPFDFYIPSLNILIEYDGRQHYKIIDHFGGVDSFIDTKIRDTIKTWYCEKNGIKLIRIPYWDFDNIEEILKKSLKNSCILCKNII